MTYELYFIPAARKEWNKLGTDIREQFKKQLARRLENPHVKSSQLSGVKNCYKIKLKSQGYRLVYQVDDNKIQVIVVSVGKRNKSIVYLKALDRLKEVLSQ